MLSAAQLVKTARLNRQMTIRAAAECTEVSAATISRIESGAVDPTWGTMKQILTYLGYRFGTELVESGSDDTFARTLRRLREADSPESVLRRFPVEARTAPVTQRAGYRTVGVTDGLPAAIARLADQGQNPIISTSEAFAGDASRFRSFSPVIYVESPDDVEGFTPSSIRSARSARLLAATANVRAVAREANGWTMVSREWALLDSLAFSGRQADSSLFLVDRLTKEYRK